MLRGTVIGWEDTDPDCDAERDILPGRLAVVERREKVIAGFLATLGFQVVPKEQIHVGVESCNGNGYACPYGIREEKIVVISEDSRVRLKRGGKAYKTIPAERQLGYIQAANYIPSLKLFWLATHLDEPEGCTLETDVDASLVIEVDL